MKRLTVTGLVATAVLAAAAGWYFLAPHTTTPPTDDRKVLYWTDPMVPGYRSDKPGKSPFMDMELVPVYADENPVNGAPTVAVSADVVQKLAVRTDLVRRTTAQHRLTASGYLFREDGAYSVIADVFDSNTQWLRPGLAAEARVAGIADVRFPARIEHLATDRDIGGRSLRLHARLLRPDARLQANLAVEITVSAPAAARLLVPREAVIRTEQRTVLVRVLDDGRFQPVDVITGSEFGDQIEIRQGVREGEKIVVSGQFLIDSESNLRESLKRMEPGAGKSPADHQH